MIATKLLEGKIDPAALTEIAHEIAQVEAVLEEQVGSRIALVESVCAHTLRAGGKRLRPALVTLAAKATGRTFDADRAHRLGACMEMIHMATLIHDDVIDGADTRRGKPTASAVYGSTAAILSGDVLLARAMAILAADGDLGIIRLVSGAVVELAEGEVAELESRGRLDLTASEHFQILRMKTASFIEACCRAGAKVAGAPEDEEAALGQYGHHIGMAFQIVDDLLDYRGDLSQTGKPRATDFIERCPTLPLIALVERMTDGKADWLRTAFDKPSTDHLDEVVRLMEQSGAFEAAEEKADEHTIKAVEAVQLLPESDSRDLLQAVARFVRMRSA